MPPSFPQLRSLSLPVVPSIHLGFKSVKRSSNIQPSDIVWPHIAVLGVLKKVRSISHAISTRRENVGDRVAISNSIYAAEYELLWMEFPRPDGITGKIDTSESVRLATLLFLHLAVRELPLKADLNQRIIDNLFYSLPRERDLSIVKAPETSLHLLMWAFFIGIVSTANSARHALLVQRVCELSLALGLESYAKLICALKKILWLDHFCGNRSVALWDEISSCSSRMH